VISRADLAVEGRIETFHHTFLRLIGSSLNDITASIAEVQMTLVSLTSAVASAVPQLSLDNGGGDNIPPMQKQPQQPSHQHESVPSSDPCIVPVAPIQVVRNMHSWITGQRPDGKSETTARGDESAVPVGAASEETDIRS